MYQLDDHIKQIKSEVLNTDNIEKTNDGYYRYICHKLKLATTGFRTREALLRNTDIIRFDPSTINLMENNYNTMK